MTSKRLPSPTDPCPCADDILALVSGRPLRPSDYPAIAHLASCPDCQEALSFALAAKRCSDERAARKAAAASAHPFFRAPGR